MARVGFAIHGFAGDARDYFHFPIPGDYTVVDPVASYLCPFDEAFAFCYRYQSLRLDFDVTMDDGAGNVENLSGSQTTNNIPVAITDELHIISQPYIRQFGSTTDPTEGAFVDVMLNTFISANPADTQWEIFLDVAVQTQIGTITTNPVSGPASLFLSILGHNIQMYCALATTGTVSVSVDSWYEYDDGTGPIWDDSDGHQLIDPIPINMS